MNTLLLLLVSIPILEILIMIKIGQQIGALNTVLFVIFTAFIGVYFAKMAGINTIKSGLKNIYQNKVPVYEIFSGASIAIAAILLIIPGFTTDIMGFALLVPFTRKIIISYWMKKKYTKTVNPNEDVVEAEIIEKNKDENEL
jgi:UPF0716 protein FxsA